MILGILLRQQLLKLHVNYSDFTPTAQCCKPSGHKKTIIFALLLCFAAQFAGILQAARNIKLKSLLNSIYCIMLLLV
jgi:hypothetical protein